MSQSQRLFCAVEISGAVRDEVGRYVAGLRTVFPGADVRWEGAERWHITLKFLGEVESGRVATLREAIRGAVEDVGAFRLELANGGVFPPRGAARVLWLGVAAGDGELRELQGRVEEHCVLAGFEREARRFRPHLTIARLKSNDDEARRLARHHQAARFALAPFVVREVILMRSELRPGGPLYTPISRYALVDDSR